MNVRRSPSVEKETDSFVEIETADRKRELPGETGVWVFILGDLLIFSLFFVVLMDYRSEYQSVFHESAKQLNQVYGLINTLLLLTSSLFVAQAVKAIRTTELRSKASLCLMGAIILGLGFALVKVFEWSEKIGAGITVKSNEFFMFYFMYTGVHLIHVLFGLAILILVYFLSRRAEIGEKDIRLIESAGVFWHLVDLLWVILFALFYLAE